MTNLAAMTNDQVFAWLSEHADAVAEARTAFEACVMAYALFLEQHPGSFDREGTDAKRFAEQIMDRADAMLPDELRIRLNI